MQFEPKITVYEPKKLIQVRINYGEVDHGRLVKVFGGKWNEEKKLWKFAYINMLMSNIGKFLNRDLL